MASNIEHGYFVRTTNQPQHFRLVWTIENFLDYPAKIGKSIRSPPFTCTAGTELGVECHLDIYPLGVTEENEKMVGAFVKVDNLPEKVKDMKVNIDLSLIDSLNKKVKTTLCLDPLQELFDNVTKGRGWPRFISREELRKCAHALLPDGHLTLECNVTTHYELKSPVSTVRIETQTDRRISSYKEAEVLKMVYEDKLCPDVRLKASDGPLFDANKCILSARSTYFKAMFQQPLKENEVGLVDLSHYMNGQELQELLHYIYLDTPPDNLSDTTRKMFRI